MQARWVLLIALTSIGAILLLLAMFLRREGGLLRIMQQHKKLRNSVMKLFNPLARKIAGSRFGPFCLLKHVGRSSGREYVTPLGALPLGDGFVLPLAYGTNVDWCRNVMAAGKCTLIWKEHEYVLEKPEILPATEIPKAHAGIQQYLWLHQQRAVPEKVRGPVSSLG